MRFNITQKSAQGSVLLWNPNEFTESHRCPLSRTIINKSHPASYHLSKTAFLIILQLYVTKKKKKTSLLLVLTHRVHNSFLPVYVIS